MSKPSDKKEINRHDIDLYWPTSIKDTIPLIMKELDLYLALEYL